MQQAAERALREAMASGHPVALHDAIANVRYHQLATPLLQQAADHLAVAQQRALEALSEARARCSRAAQGREALAALDALDAAAEWAWDVGAEVPPAVRDQLRSAGRR